MTAEIEITTLIGPLEQTIDQSTGQRVIRGTSTGRWGIDTTGNAYYDPTGADAGEHAVLSVDSTGNPIISAARVRVATTRIAGRLFVAAVRSAPERAYARAQDGTLFGASVLVEVARPPRRGDGTLFGPAPLVEPNRIARRPDGRAFGRGQAGASSPRSYDRGSDGRLFANATTRR